MAYGGLKLFMEKLKQMLYTNDISVISNHPSMLSKRPQLQLLYEELGLVIQTGLLFVENGNDLPELVDLKKRFKDVAEDACETVDLFIYVINFKIKRLPRVSNFFEISLNLEDVMRSLKSIKEEFISILKNMRMESSPRANSLKTTCVAAAAAETSCSRNSTRSNKVWDEIVVGLDWDIGLIRDKLVEDTKKLDVVSIVGTGGSGKTTLASKVFNDRFVGYHFNVRGWVTVSQTYETTDLLNRILASIGIEIDLDKRDSCVHLREKLHKRLMDRRYLVVIDDIWSTKAWDDLKIVFPHNNNGSRLLLTSRHKKVALYAKPHGLVHQIRYLTDDESWELLHKKVFQGNSFPESLTVPGMQIARNCDGLPLAVVVIAGLLANEPVSKHSWERISLSGRPLVFSNLKGHMESLALSMNHLPSHLKDCFLYLGGFPEDYTFQVTRLIWLWIAEGFIHEDKIQSLEDTATGYVMELVDRNLVVVQDRKFNGTIKAISVHDVLRELCLEEAKKERLYLKVQGSDDLTGAPYKARRIFTDRYISNTNATRIRSLLSVCSYPYASHIISKFSHSWALLLVLDLRQCPLIDVPGDISLLINLRYLAIRSYHRDFQSRICDLWNLQTLIIEGISNDPLVFPNTISNLVYLRHLFSHRTIIFPPLDTPIMKLQTISSVVLPKSWKQYFPCVEKLSCFIYLERKYDFKSLTILKTLKINSMKWERTLRFQKNNITFPNSLKKLTLQGCRLPWSYMSRIQSLPNLQVLKLLRDAFVGEKWDAGEDPFQQLKFLKLSWLDIKQWEASSTNFPCLQNLFLENCNLLEEIPPEMGYIQTLEHIQIDCCEGSVTESAYKIQQVQHDDGNVALQISDISYPSKDSCDKSVTESDYKVQHDDDKRDLEVTDINYMDVLTIRILQDGMTDLIQDEVVKWTRRLNRFLHDRELVISLLQIRMTDPIGDDVVEWKRKLDLILQEVDGLIIRYLQNIQNMQNCMTYLTPYKVLVGNKYLKEILGVQDTPRDISSSTRIWNDRRTKYHPFVKKHFDRK